MAETTYLYVGNWGIDERRPEHGFGIFRFDGRTGGATPVKRVYEEARVGAACFHPARKDVLYFVDERVSCDGKGYGGGQVIAVRLDPATGDMAEINRRSTFAPLPSYVCTDKAGRYLLVANHGAFGAVTKTARDSCGEYHVAIVRDDSGIVLYPLGSDGFIGAPSDIFHLWGSGPLDEQQSSHPHIVKMAPDGSVFAVCDRGADMVYLFQIDRERDRLFLCAGHRCAPGSSPRHCVFHPTLPYLVANNETRPVLSVFRYGRSELAHVCDASALPSDAPAGENILQSDLQIHPSGDFVYSLIRGANAISVFRFDGECASLKLLQTAPVEGKSPKGCAVTGDGRFLMVGARDSGEVCLYRIDSGGRLAFTGA
ncbi:MAG: lactonase family protein, partial [Clostridiales bacterium]|nr:lactonase family protein [Clostridiales bacterium]